MKENNFYWKWPNPAICAIYIQITRIAEHGPLYMLTGVPREHVPCTAPLFVITPIYIELNTTCSN